MSERTPSPARRPTGPVVTALVVLAAHVLIALTTPLPGYFRKYALAAEHHLAGELPAERLMDFSPFYFHLSVAAERWLPAPEAFVHWLQVVLVAASAGLLYGLLRRRFAPLMSAVMVAVFAADRHVLVYERILEPEAFLLFFLLGFLFFLDRGNPAKPAGASAAGPWIAGAFAALSIATRPTFLPVFLLTPIYLRLGDPKTWLRRSVALLLPVAAMMGLLMIRAATATGDPRAPVMNPGTVFFEGNNALSRGTSAIYPPLVLELVRHGGEISDSAHHFYRAVARADTGEDLSIAGINAYWSSRAMAFIRAEPGRFARLVLDKLNRCFHGFRWHDIPIAWQYDRWLPVPTVSFALVATLGLLGALFDVRRWRASLLFYAAGLAQLGVMLAFYVSARQRLILVPVAVYFAAVALERLRELGRRGVLLAILVVLMTLVLWIPDDLMRDESYRRHGHQETDHILHQIREKTRDEPLAHHADLAVAAMASSPWWIDWLRPAYFPQNDGPLEARVADALAERPRDLFATIPADFDLATVSLAAGRIDPTRRLLEDLVDSGGVVYRAGRQPSLPQLLLGQTLVLAGDREAGREQMERALEESPGDPFALAELAALTGESHYRELLETYWGRLDAAYLLGRALLRYERAAEAADELAFVIERLPDFREPQIYLAAAMAELGRTEEAAQTYLLASAIRLEPIVAGPKIAELFRQWSRENPERPEVLFYSAQVLHQLGHFDEALVLLDNLEPPENLRPAVAEERQRLLRVLQPN